MIDTLTPLGVGSEYSWMRSGCAAGHFFAIGKTDGSGMKGPCELESENRDKYRPVECALLAVERTVLADGARGRTVARSVQARPRIRSIPNRIGPFVDYPMA